MMERRMVERQKRMMVRQTKNGQKIKMLDKQKQKNGKKNGMTKKNDEKNDGKKEERQKGQIGEKIWRKKDKRKRYSVLLTCYN